MVPGVSIGVEAGGIDLEGKKIGPPPGRSVGPCSSNIDLEGIVLCILSNGGVSIRSTVSLLGRTGVDATDVPPPDCAGGYTI